MRFIHIADVHLGAVPDAGYPWAKKRSQEIWETFESVLKRAKKERVDLVLISGDLFHGQPLEGELREVNELFASLGKTRVVLIAGNHDYLKQGSAYLSFAWSENVTCLWSGSCERVQYEGIKTEIYGFSYTQREITAPLYDGLCPERNGYFHILLAHGGDERHIPVSRQAMERSAFDYIALGHIHRPHQLVKGKAVYAGALEPIDRNDTGPHGFVEGIVDRDGMRLRFVPAAKREYVHLKVRVTPEDTDTAVRERVRQEMYTRGKQNLYKIILQGYRNPECRFDTGRYGELGHVLEALDETYPAYDMEQLRQQYGGQLIARYIESFDGQEEDTVQQKALSYGVEALLHTGTALRRSQ